LTFYGSALASVKRAHIGCPELVERMPWRARRAVNIGAQLLVIAFFALLGGVGVWITPILATDTLVSLPWIPMSVVQSVIPIAAVVAMVTSHGLGILPNLAIVAYNGATSFPLLAIPLFILAGAIMNASGISRRLIAFASSLFGWARGGLAHVSIGASMFFAEI